MNKSFKMNSLIPKFTFLGFLIIGFGVSPMVGGQNNNPENSPPVANAGFDQTLGVLSTAILDGSGSSDLDGDTLTFQWAIASAPAGSLAEISDPTLKNPTFEVDVSGTYVVELIVNDGNLDSEKDMALINTTNSFPVADAGPDQTVEVGENVLLDGGKSFDVDGDSIRYHWSFISAPLGSGSMLFNSGEVNSTFTADVPGEYIFELVVMDDEGESEPDIVTIRTENSLPVANAGPDRKISLNQTIFLDGSGSTDVDGDLLSYAWALTSVPPGSDASIEDPGTVAPSFFADVPGDYVAQLVIHAGIDAGPPDTVVFSTVNSRPVANGGQDQTVLIGDTVYLDSTGSYDPNGSFLNSYWSLIQVPSGSAAQISNPNSFFPTFKVDQPGVYIAQLIVSDGTFTSIPDTVIISTINSRPVAEAGTDQVLLEGDSVQLDGLDSFDADFDTLTYHWDLITVPSGSTASISDPASSSPSFTMDLPGTYIAQLIVNDGTVDSFPDTVVINTPEIRLLGFPKKLGAGLQDDFSAQLNLSQHGGINLFVESSDPSIALVSQSRTSPGSESIEIPVLNGQSSAVFYVQSINGAEGSVEITASATGFSSDSETAEVVQPGLGIFELSRFSTPLSEDDPFRVSIGVPTGDRSGIQDFQTVSAGGSPLTVTLTNSQPNVGRLVTQGNTGQNVTVQIQPGEGSSPFGVSGGGVAFDSLELGETTVSATIPGFVETDGASQVVTVSPPAIRLSGFPTQIGSGLQSGYFSAQLMGSQHGGVTVRVESSDPTLGLVSPNSSTPGTPSIEVSVANGLTFVNFYIQGMEGETREFEITVSAEGFIEGTGTVNVVQPGIRIQNLPLNTTLLSADSPFQVSVGIPNQNNSNLLFSQAVRMGGSPLIATINNSEPNVGQLLTQGVNGQTVTVEISPGSSSSPFNASSGGVDFDPLGLGTTTVSASIPGFIPTDAASQNVTVDVPEIRLTGLPAKVGSGLQTGFSARLGGSDHGGVTVRVESGDPAIALVSPNSTTPGSPFIDISVPNGTTFVPFTIEGVTEVTGSASITVSAPGFTNGSGFVEVVQPGLRIDGLSNNTTLLSSDNPFQVLVGVPNAGNENLQSLQQVKAGGSSLAVTVTNSIPAVGQLNTQGSTGQSVTVQIPAGQFSSPFNVESGGVAFDPLGLGTTTVSASIPGFIQTGAATQNVTVSTPGISLSGFPTTVGAGLQLGFFSTRLGGSEHDGVTVRIESSHPTIALVSSNSTSAGTPFVDIPLANGSTFINFVIQGVEGATGNATITASAPGFTDGSGNVTVVQPGLRIEGLSINSNAFSPNDSFQVVLGVPNSGNTNLITSQPVRGGSSGIIATIANSDSTVGQLVTQNITGQSVTVQIQPGQSSSAFGNLAFDPLGEGTTTVSASIPGFISTSAATQNVTVSTPEIILSGFPATIGAGLQLGFFGQLGGSQHGGVTVRIESSDPSIALVSPNGTTEGTPFIDLSISKGSTYISFGSSWK